MHEIDDFHTIKSILNIKLQHKHTFSIHHFHTIKSILNKSG